MDDRGASDTEGRLVELESRFAYQEHTISELNDALCEQQVQLDRLKKRLEQLEERVGSESPGLPIADIVPEKPPHY